MGWGTREAAEQLGVSQTTLKRWVAHFPDAFPKDRLGHYIYSEAEMERLAVIKAQVRDGVPIEQVQLPEAASPAVQEQEQEQDQEQELAAAAAAEPMTAGASAEAPEHTPASAALAPASPAPAAGPDSLRLRLEHLERMIDRKADEVVTAQLYQHRHELDELRGMIAQVADALDKMRQAAAGLESGMPLKSPPQSAMRPEASRPAQETRRKRFGLF